MRHGTGDLYPRLGRFFENTEELAAAACMSRPTLLKSLRGQRSFTRSEENAIRNDLIKKVVCRETSGISLDELIGSNSFDELFKAKAS